MWLTRKLHKRAGGYLGLDQLLGALSREEGVEVIDQKDWTQMPRQMCAICVGVVWREEV